MNNRRPLATGFAFASTAGLLYLLCALAVAVAPDVLIRVLGVFVHGLNIAPLGVGAAPMELVDVAMGLVFICLYAFFGGLVYALATNFFFRAPATRR